MRNMSFSLTTAQMYAGTKTVTRRYGWWFLQPGNVVMAVEKAMGLRKGERLVRIRPIRVLSVTSEPLSAIRDYPDDCTREGFPEMTPDEFIAMLTRHSGQRETDPVNRIEFEPLGLVSEQLELALFNA